MSGKTNKRRRAPGRGQLRKPGGKPTIPRLNVAIATYPESGVGGVTLANEVNLVKASLLYADKIELVSIGYSMLDALRQVSDSGLVGMVQVLTSLDDVTIANLGWDMPSGWRETILPALAIMSLDDDVFRALPGGDEIPDDFFRSKKESSEGMADAVTQMQELSGRLLNQSGASQILPAVAAGIVTTRTIGGSDTDDTTVQWQDHMTKLLVDPKVRLLFDEKVAAFIKTMIEAGAVDMGPLPLKHSAEASVGSGLIARLPAFIEAPIDELLTLRSDLADPLKRYRVAAARFSASLQFKTYEGESEAEIDDLYMFEVDPVLTELREGFAEHGLVREIGRATFTDIKTLITGGASASIALALNQAGALDVWLSGGAAVAAGAAQVAGTAVTTQARERRGPKSSELFYLYELNRRM